MSMQIKVSVSNDVLLDELGNVLSDRRGLYARLAGDAEAFMRRVGPGIAAQNHRTADTLGARRTGHLENAYAAIEGDSDNDEARLWVPRASRLRAAFGAYRLTPVNGSRYLTLPVHPDAYGRRARELRDLFFMRVGPAGVPVLARRAEGRQQEGLKRRTYQRRKARARYTVAEILYVLATSVDIPAQPGLIPFDELTETIGISAEAYLDEAIERSLPT
jgi:hypothetical protein